MTALALNTWNNIVDKLGVIEMVNFAVVMLITFIITKITSKIFRRDKLKNELHIKFIKNFIIATQWTIGICIALYSFDTFKHLSKTILTGSGIIAVILGFAAQESVSNLFSGIFICLFKPFNIKDRISIDSDGVYGFVEDITLRHTVIRTYTNVRLIIPNSVIAKAKIENSTYSNGAAYNIEVTIAYENRFKRHRALEIMEEVVKSHPKFYKDKADSVKALCTSFGESGINLKVMMWTKDVNDNILACSECRMEILDRFEAEGIEIPYNKLQLVDKANEYRDNKID